MLPSNEVGQTIIKFVSDGFIVSHLLLPSTWSSGGYTPRGVEVGGIPSRGFPVGRTPVTTGPVGV